MRQFLFSLLVAVTVILAIVSSTIKDVETTGKGQYQICGVFPTPSGILDKSVDVAKDLCEGYQNVPYGYCEP